MTNAFQVGHRAGRRSRRHVRVFRNSRYPFKLRRWPGAGQSPLASITIEAGHVRSPNQSKTSPSRVGNCCTQMFGRETRMEQDTHGPNPPARGSRSRSRRPRRAGGHPRGARPGHEHEAHAGPLAGRPRCADDLVRPPRRRRAVPGRAGDHALRPRHLGRDRLPDLLDLLPPDPDRSGEDPDALRLDDWEQTVVEYGRQLAARSATASPTSCSPGSPPGSGPTRSSR